MKPFVGFCVGFLVKYYHHLTQFVNDTHCQLIDQTKGHCLLTELQCLAFYHAPHAQDQVMAEVIDSECFSSSPPSPFYKDDDIHMVSPPCSLEGSYP
jgi:hypothetical protein